MAASLAWTEAWVSQEGRPLWGKQDLGQRETGSQTQQQGLHSTSFTSVKHRDGAAQSAGDTPISGARLTLRESRLQKTNKRVA